MILLCLAPGFAAPWGAQPGSAGTANQAGEADIRASQAVQAGDRLITVGRFRFRIVRVAFDTTATGFVPEGMGPKDLVMFVECELVSGRRDDFQSLTVVLDRGSGRRSKASVLFSGGMMKALTALAIETVSYAYRPKNSNIAWAFVVNETEADFTLIFPTGAGVDLAPWIKDLGAAMGDDRHLQASVSRRREARAMRASTGLTPMPGPSGTRIVPGPLSSMNGSMMSSL